MPFWIFFKTQKTIEFEKTTEETLNVNNLDLNNDNAVDYISVISYNQGRFHSIVLRVSINSNQFQDVAVRSKEYVIVQVVETKIYTERIMLWSLLRAVSETPTQPILVTGQSL
jgi:hypothetical protein